MNSLEFKKSRELYLWLCDRINLNIAIGALYALYEEMGYTYPINEG